MMPSVKHLDPIMGLDVHIVQPPGPVPPVPVPHPHIGMMFDPTDYLPVLGTVVRINGLPRVTAGTNGIAIPPHLPLGGMFIKPPTNESEMFMGSATVLADGDPLGYAPLPVLSCQDLGIPATPRKRKKKAAMSLMLPVTQVMPIPAGPPVFVGGPPAILAAGLSGLQAKLQARVFKGLGKALRRSKRLRRFTRRASAAAHAKVKRLLDKAGLDKLGWLGDAIRNRVHRAICTLTGHPVDVATGKVLTEQVDFTMPGPIPLRWERVWYSTSRYRGPLGHGWHHVYDSALLVVGDEAVAVRTADGREQAFLALAIGAHQYDRKEKTTLFRDAEGYGLRTRDGLIHRFAEVLRGEPQRVVRIEDPAGHMMRFEYVRGRLERLVDSCGRALTVSWDAEGRISQIAAPHPTEPDRQQVLVAYAYDPRGNLIEVRDALGQAMRFEYARHLLVRETNRNGLSFHFEYDGEDATARCLHTWGDGGIYDHKLTYEPGYTIVTDSLGARTTYFHVGGVVVKTVDPLGLTTINDHNSYGELVQEVDPLGRATMYTHDDRGNCVSIEQPGGATVSMRYDGGDRLIAAQDPVGGRWRWGYDGLGRIAEREDALGRIVRFEYTGANLTAFVDPAGQRTAMAYQSGNLVAVRTPDGAESRWDYDRRGRVVTATDPKGNVQRREHDALDRVLRVDEPDGAVRELGYDGEGNVVLARDQQRTVRFSYVGTGRLASRTEAGTTVSFDYDPEERLIGLRNEHGFAYRFVLGLTGEVEEEIAFDGARRRYVRDRAGQVIQVERPGATTAYVYDAAGRVVAVTHSDGSAEAYQYRSDGELLEARNDTATVKFERDALGRITRELVGDEWVESLYNILGLRIRMRSSKGFEQSIKRNAMGDVMGIRAAAPRLSGGSKPKERRPRFEATFTRDALGLELERALPGGIRARWTRDKLGRPLQHEIRSGDKVTQAWSYTWDPNDRLRSITSAMKGPVVYKHDAVGNLAAAIYEDGRIDLRMPDAVGNLFRTEDRSDRKYGAAGQLLESRGPDGVTRYEYDPEGNLVRKTEPGDRVWRYEWNAAGMLARVVRPDGAAVEFGYDALARRVWKKFGEKTTRWLWDGNVPLHEWVESPTSALETKSPAPSPDAVTPARHAALLTSRPSQGPPSSEGTKQAPITWVFEPETFSPIAKLQGTDHLSILTDHLGTPKAMFDSAGTQVWGAEVDTFGRTSTVISDRARCPFAFPGQHRDDETGLSYNRFRYYDPDIGQYISPDPIGLHGGLAAYAYVHDPLVFVDYDGLTGCLPGRRLPSALSWWAAAVRDAVVGVATPYGRARQSLRPTALRLRQATLSGKKLYRGGTMGRSLGPEGQFWGFDHPRTPGFAAKQGIPPANVQQADFVETAQLRPGARTAIRISPAAGGNPGGEWEAVVKSGDVRLVHFETCDPGTAIQ